MTLHSFEWIKSDRNDGHAVRIDGTNIADLILRDGLSVESSDGPEPIVVTLRLTVTSQRVMLPSVRVRVDDKTAVLLNDLGWVYRPSDRVQTGSRV